MTNVSRLFLSLSTQRLREECEALGKTVLCRKSAIAALIAAGLISAQAVAHDIYTEWKRPDVGGSCCSNYDCAPAVSRFVDGHWEARVGERWLVIPEAKILKFDSPDGLSHLCKSRGSDEVFCFMRPGVLG